MYYHVDILLSCSSTFFNCLQYYVLFGRTDCEIDCQLLQVDIVRFCDSIWYSWSILPSDTVDCMFGTIVAFDTIGHGFL